MKNKLKTKDQNINNLSHKDLQMAYIKTSNKETIKEGGTIDHSLFDQSENQRLIIG